MEYNVKFTIKEKRYKEMIPLKLKFALSDLFPPYS